jgi:energy-coupling factor transport system substrate-specific component
MNPVAWIQGLEGLTLVAIICAFLFTEEVGVPLPFAPGDLLLAIAGIAIAAGRVNPELMVGVAFAAILAGALAGRELFALLGWERLTRVARPLHANGPLQRAAELVRSGGWRAVFTARLIPGLRVHTTQVAGVSRMQRRQFAAGLVPATAVYVAAFVGLGAAFGRPILLLIHEAEHQILVLALVVVVPVVLALALRAPARRTLASVGGWSGVFRFRLDSPGIMLVPACIGLNFAGHALAVGLGLPLFLDSTGTVLSALLAGPWVGGSVGVISSLLSANTIDANAAGYVGVSFAIGFAAGLTRYARGGWIALWCVCFVVASVLSTPLNLVLNGGRSGVPLGDAIYARLLAAGLPRLAATYLGEAAIDLPDKLIAVVAALLVFRALPAPAVPARVAVLDVGASFTFVFRSRHWPRAMLAGALCVALSILVVPLLLFMGYAVAIARGARGGERDLPSWRPLRARLVDGGWVSLLFLAWYLPGAVALAIAGDLFRGASGALDALGGVWGLLILFAQPAIWSQYLQHGFRAGFDVPAIARRMRFNPGLTSVVGVLGIGLLALALSGLAAVAVGVVLTGPYTAWVAAHLIGEFSGLTDEPAQRAA